MRNTGAAFSEQCMRDVAHHQVPYSRMGIENILNSAEEEDVIEIITTESQLEFIIGNSNNTESDTEVVDDDEVYTTAEELKALAIATTALERQERMTTKAQSMTRASEKELLLDEKSILRHTSILDNFKSQ